MYGLLKSPTRVLSISCTIFIEYIIIDKSYNCNYTAHLVQFYLYMTYISLSL
jgi:hypothetical protein